MNQTHFNDSGKKVSKKPETPTYNDFRKSLKTRILQDIELIYREYCKTQEIAKNKSTLPYAKLMHFAPDKWK